MSSPESKMTKPLPPGLLGPLYENGVALWQVCRGGEKERKAELAWLVYYWLRKVSRGSQEQKSIRRRVLKAAVLRKGLKQLCNAVVR